jgi:hypothetical protein
LEFSHTENRGAVWLFQCSCGKACLKRTHDVKWGGTRSCGHLLTEYRSIGPRTTIEERRERAARTSRIYRQRNRQKIRLWKRLWAAQNPEKIKTMKRDSYLRNRSYCLAKTAQWTSSHPLKRRDISRRSASRNRTLTKIRRVRENFLKAKLWTEAHPEAMAKCPL